MSREQTNRLLEMIDDGLPASLVVTMCVKWMSEPDVAEMMDANELSERFDVADDDDDDDTAPKPPTPNTGTQK